MLALIVLLIVITYGKNMSRSIEEYDNDKYHENLIKYTNISQNVSIIKQDYEYWCIGNCNSFRRNTNPHPGIIIMGGSTDVDDAFRQQITWSDCGDFLIIRASGSNGYNSYIYNLGCSSSVRTILINNRNGANNEFVINLINNSSAIFFAGGDQGKYIQDWMNTNLQIAIQNAKQFQ